MSQTFLVTGVSSGFGRAIAAAALAAGHRVIGTVRRETDIESFETLAPDRAHAIPLDVTHFDLVDEVVAEMVARFGPIADYDALFDPIRKARSEKSGRQTGDPARAAQAILDLVAMEDPPVHLLLGSDALGLVKPALEARLSQIQAWEGVSRSTNFS